MMEHKSILLDRLSREQKMIVKTSQIRDLLDAPISSWLYNRGAFPMVQSTIKMAQGAYPETVDKIYVVNTPWLMSTVWCEFVDVSFSSFRWKKMPTLTHTHSLTYSTHFPCLPLQPSCKAGWHQRRRRRSR
tara:strand:+ start:672 stop:1064 length:393 start_codon:yes stop_codon:yes gene_type:complete